ncbi:hypothetical protein F4781DRAFT_433288 [Annulohypoxylon bovei var. microspora]|nr:hypothetical protein F4781DRAFT_433288 [Annulohypoxylon bovei var. microspora]
MSVTDNGTRASPGRLPRMTLQVYGNMKNRSEDNEAFSRDYLAKVASIHARNGIEAYQQVFTPPPYRAALGRGCRSPIPSFFSISPPYSADHDITVEFYFRSFADLEKVHRDPDSQMLQAVEGPYVNLVHAVVSLGWVEKYVDDGKVVNVRDGKPMYPPWAELQDLSTAAAGGK